MQLVQVLPLFGFMSSLVISVKPTRDDGNYCFEEGLTWDHDNQIEILVDVLEAADCQTHCR